MSFLGMNLKEIEERKISVIPDDFYSASILSADLVAKDTILVVRFKITHGRWQDTILKSSFMQVHPNPMVIEIGKRRFKNLATAAGIHDFITDSDELIGREVRFKTHTTDRYGSQPKYFFSPDYIPTEELNAEPPPSSSVATHPDLDDDLPF